MKTPLIVLVVALTVTSAWAGRRAGGGSISREGPNGGSIDAEGGHVGRFGAGSVDATGPNGGTYDSEGAHAGRYGARDVNATGANGGTYDSSTVRAPGYSSRDVNATGANGGTYDASATRTGAYSTATVNATTVNGSWSGYRSGYYYTGGVYRPANIAVNTVYVAPIGAYAGWSVMTQPYYVSYPQYATYPVEIAVQVQLQRLGYNVGDIDGIIGPATVQAITKYQANNGLQPTGTINKALLKSLNII